MRARLPAFPCSRRADTYVHPILAGKTTARDRRPSARRRPMRRGRASPRDRRRPLGAARRACYSIQRVSARSYNRARSMTIRPGTSLGSYDLLAELGEGGMGQVFRARDARLGRDVAVKIVHPRLADDADHLSRFRREAHTLASLNHPHIAAVHELDEVGGVVFLVMELVPGETLQ